MKDLMGMIPGVGKAIRDIEISDDMFKQTEAIIHSMTPAERSNPEIINPSRKERIAKGSGTTLAEVNKLLKQFDQTRKVMKSVATMKPGMAKRAPQVIRTRKPACRRTAECCTHNPTEQFSMAISPWRIVL